MPVRPYEEGASTMLLSGFTIIRNGVSFDYPFIESIKSILPICDEFIINHGNSDDTTLLKLNDLIASLPPQEAKKITIFESEWPLDDTEKRKGGKILSEQTNLALDRCKGEWCFYIQADELVHEKDLQEIRQTVHEITPQSVEGIVFRYIHFYGTYNVIQTSRSSYRRELRIIRNGLGIRSIGDAQSFRHALGHKLTAILIPVHIYHYGWVRHQDIMKVKTGFMDTLYHSGANKDRPATGNNYVYKKFVGLKPFKGVHPNLMRGRAARDTPFDFSSAPRIFEIKDIWKILSGWIEQATGHRLFEFKNYILIRRKT